MDEIFCQVVKMEGVPCLQVAGVERVEGAYHVHTSSAIDAQMADADCKYCHSFTDQRALQFLVAYIIGYLNPSINI